MFKSLLPALLFGSVLFSSTAVIPVKAENPPAAPAPTYDYQTTLQQLNSIQQLRDVSPVDWSYEALRNLVENYGCIVGYPDRTYRGDRALTRNEFAAGLNACIEQLEQRLLEARGLGQSPSYRSTAPNVQAIPEEPGEHFIDVVNRAFYNEGLRFYDNTDISGQMNKIFGWRYAAPGSFFDNQIANDGKTFETVVYDGLRQQTAGPRIRTPDLPNPFDTSVILNPQYLSPVPLSPRELELKQQQIPIIP